MPSHRSKRSASKTSAVESPPDVRDSSRWRSVRWAIVGLLLAVYWLLAVVSKREYSPVFDEPAHITAGYCYWKFNDYRLQPENGNLPQRWVALPLVLFGQATFDNPDQQAWARSDVWALAKQFLYYSGNSADQVLLSARSMVALLGAAACLVVYLWSAQLFGVRGGLLSLALCAFSPTMLAHGGLATSDMAAAFLFTLATWRIWNVLEHVTVFNLAMSTASTGLLFLSKTSAVLIVPMALLMVAIHSLVRRRLTWEWRNQRKDLKSLGARLGAILGIAALHAAITVLMVWAFYGGRYSVHPPGASKPVLSGHRSLDEACQAAGRPGAVLGWAGRHRLLPEAFLHGTAFVLAESHVRAAYLNGDYSVTGWRHYFPFCVLVKTPLALFGLLGLAAAAMYQSRRRPNDFRGLPDCRLPGVFQLTPLLVLLAVYWTAAISSKLNIGHRHVLPTYPAMFILSGAAAAWTCRGRKGLLVVSLLLVAFAAESVRAYPTYLAYFNPLIPRERAYLHLVDSNLDWGQDLPALKRWLDARPPDQQDDPVYLGYFGTGEPEYYGIDAVQLPIQDLQQRNVLRGGTYCISATRLVGLTDAAAGRWSNLYEVLYKALENLLDGSLEALPPELRTEQNLRELDAHKEFFPHLQFSRLLAYLRQREPDAQVNYSILIYHLTDADVQQALHGPPVELDEQSWMQRESGALNPAGQTQ